MRMKLSAKGRREAPPILNAFLQPLSEELQTWPEIVASTHWHLSRNGQVDGADFYRGEVELGHIHLDGDLHLALSPALAQALVATRLALPFPFAGCDEWVLYRIRSRADAPDAKWLVRLAYEYIGGVSEAELLEVVRSGREIHRQSRGGNGTAN
jgi:hypothetical protein